MSEPAEDAFFTKAIDEATTLRDSPENRKIAALEREIAELRHHIEVTIGTGGINVTGNLIDGSNIEGGDDQDTLNEFDGCLNGAPAIGAYRGRAMSA